MKHTFIPKGVCPSKLEFELIDGTIHNLAFTSGCNGNLKAIAKLVEGMEAKRVVHLLSGNTCGYKTHPVRISSRGRFFRHRRRKLELERVHQKYEFAPCGRLDTPSDKMLL